MLKFFGSFIWTTPVNEVKEGNSNPVNEVVSCNSNSSLQEETDEKVEKVAVSIAPSEGESIQKLNLSQEKVIKSYSPDKSVQMDDLIDEAEDIDLSQLPKAKTDEKVKAVAVFIDSSEESANQSNLSEEEVAEQSSPDKSVQVDYSSNLNQLDERKSSVSSSSSREEVDEKIQNARAEQKRSKNILGMQQLSEKKARRKKTFRSRQTSVVVEAVARKDNRFSKQVNKAHN